MILNADDFGLSREVNEAIAEAFRRGLCSSASLVANGNEFESACKIIQAMGLREHVGVHLNVTVGTPLTEKMARFAGFCDQEGRLAVQRHWRLHILSRCEAEAVIAELRAQIRRCRAFGIRPTHADTHHQVGEYWAIGGALLAAAKLENVPYLRLARNVGRTGVVKKTYRMLVNRRIRSNGLARTRLFGSITDYVEVNTWKRYAGQPFGCEVMLHPRFDHGGVLIDALARQPLDGLIRELKRVYRGPFFSYSGQVYEPRSTE